MATNQSTFKITLPGELIPYLAKLSGPSMDAKVRLSVAIELFVNKVVSLARAAELAGTSYIDFMDLLKARGIPWLEYTDEDLKQDEAAIDQIVRESGKNNE